MPGTLTSRRVVMIIAILLALLVVPLGAVAHAPANEHFERTWERTDRPVGTGEVSRTWIWGPSGFTADCIEPYFKLPSGERDVQYFDKSRMEITDPTGDTQSEWFVTQGLLATEMITGRMQTGDHEHIDWGPAEVHIAGDPGGGAPSYADFAPLMDDPPLDEGESITQTLSSDGAFGDDPSLANYGVTAAHYVAETDHRVASVFWEFMNSQGTILEHGLPTNGPIFENPFYAVGFPLTEAYWMNIEVGGVQQEVLVQAFERRVVTYTPGNDAGWQVEAGNVGQHYYIWRYGEIPENSEDACPQTLHVTFHVYEQRDGGWDQIAVTETREVWHPGDIATGTWATYTDDNSEPPAMNSSGIMIAGHSYTSIGGQRFLASMDAEVWEIDGPSGGTAEVSAGNFALGPDSRIPGSFFTGSGTLSYDTGAETGSVGFDVAGTGFNTFHVFLDGPAPPVFFR